jgi:hypothetical protein
VLPRYQREHRGKPWKQVQELMKNDWKKLEGTEERVKFEEEHEKLREQYRQELAEWKKRHPEIVEAKQKKKEKREQLKKERKQNEKKNSSSKKFSQKKPNKKFNKKANRDDE